MVDGISTRLSVSEYCCADTCSLACSSLSNLWRGGRTSQCLRIAWKSQADLWNEGNYCILHFRDIWIASYGELSKTVRSRSYALQDRHDAATKVSHQPHVPHGLLPEVPARCLRDGREMQTFSWQLWDSHTSEVGGFSSGEGFWHPPLGVRVCRVPGPCAWMGTIRYDSAPWSAA
jgi:hypothetical protein